MPALRLAALIFVASAVPAFATPSVLASVKPVHSLVAGVMEGVGTPHLMLDAAQSPHAYAMTPSDAARLERADLVVWVGPALESFLERPIHTIAAKGAALRLDRVPGLVMLDSRAGGAWDGHAHGDEHAHDDHGHDDHGHDDHGHDDHAHDEHAHDEHAHDEHADGNDHAHDADGADPHFWLDPGNALAMVDAIAGRLAALDPANAGVYAANATAMKERIRAADARAAGMLAPVAERPFIVFHDAYQYFEAHYGLNGVGSITLSADRQPGARRLVELRERIETAGVVCLFREPQFPPALVETVVEGTGARVGTLDPLGVDLAPGAAAYPALIEGLARELVDCLAPAG